MRSGAIASSRLVRVLSLSIRWEPLIIFEQNLQLSTLNFEPLTFPLSLPPGKPARPAPAELPQDRKVARVGS